MSDTYTYDQAGRLTNVVDATMDAGGVTSCTDRAYTFDKQGNRTDLNTATGASCSTLPAGSDSTYAYDNFSRQTTGANGSGSYVYDAFGRQTTIPAADAPNNAGAAITMSYFDTDAVRSITQTTGAGTDTTTFTLDPDGRRLTSTDVIGSTTTVTTNHYALGSDNPAWSSQTSGSATASSSYLPTLGSASAVVSTSSGATTASLSLLDLAGSVVASVGVSSSADSLGISGYSSFDEYGNVETAGASTGVNTYGWEGATQRAVTTAGLTLMGARIYDGPTGRFSSIDPVAGGNENAYNYPDAPTVSSDLTGEAKVKKVKMPNPCVGKNKIIKTALWITLYVSTCIVADVINQVAIGIGVAAAFVTLIGAIGGAVSAGVVAVVAGAIDIGLGAAAGIILPILNGCANGHGRPTGAVLHIFRPLGVWYCNPQ